MRQLKIAVFDPDPRICGVTTYGIHTREGFRQLGHQADLVTFTKSGKARKKWGPEAIATYGGDEGFSRVGCKWCPVLPDHVVHELEGREFLDTYDMIFLVEPICPTIDNDCARSLDTPYYMWLLERTKTPWVTHVHGPHYESSKWIAEMFALPTYRGTTITRQWHREHPPIDTLVDMRHIVVGSLPYTPRYAIKDKIRRAKSVGYMARLAPNKGLSYLIYLADKLPRAWSTDIYGSCSIGLGPCMSYKIYETLVARGFAGKIHLDEKTRKSIEASGSNPVLKPHPWEANADGHVARYHGGFGSIDDLDISVYTALTSPHFQKQMFEYTALELMDSGAYGVHAGCQRSEVTEQFNVAWFDAMVPTSDLTENLFNRPEISEALMEFAIVVNNVIEQHEAGELDEKIEANRMSLRIHNDPRKVAKALIALCMGESE